MKQLLFLTLTVMIATNKINAQEQGKSALILIETQNEWMHTGGKLYKTLVKDKEMMHTSIKNIEKALDYARKTILRLFTLVCVLKKVIPS